MPSFSSLLVVMAVAFGAPLLLGLFPRVQLPSVVLEIVAGIVVGPSVLGIAEVDETVEVVAVLGLAFVLFLAGLEIEFEKLRGRVLRLTGLGFALSFAIALVVALGLKAGGLVDTPLLVAIILCATSLGVLVPVLKDAGEISSTFGQLIIASASIADFGAIILLSIFFSGEGGTGSTVLLLGALFLLAAVVFGVVRGAERSMRIREDLLRLQDTTAQIRVRAYPSGFPAQARGGRLRLLHPRLLRDERRALRPRRAHRVGFEPRDGPDLPGRPGRGAWAARSAVPEAARRPALRDRRPHASHVAAVHRRRDGDRDGPRADRRGEQRGADRRRAAVRPALPPRRPRAPAAGRRSRLTARLHRGAEERKDDPQAGQSRKPSRPCPAVFP